MSFLGARNSISLGIQGMLYADTGTGASGIVGYFLNKSLRFRSSASAYLNRTASAAISTFTVSMWVKRGILSSSNYQYLFSYFNSGNTDGYGLAYFASTDTLYVYAGGALQQTTAVYRDPAAWYHIVFSNNAGSFTLYVNGVSVKTGTAATIPSNSSMNIGRYGYGGGLSYFDGELAEVNFVDGQALAPTSFGAFSTYNQWLPIKYAGTYGTNGFYLPFTNTTSTSTLVADSSGNGNNWTPNNISLTAGSTYDSLTDVPTLTSATVANYAVLNPLDGFQYAPSILTMTNGNLTATVGTAAAINGVASIALTSGKWYAEFTVKAFSTGSSLMWFGANDIKGFTGNSSAYNSSGAITFNGSSTSGYATFGVGDIIGCAFDITNNTATYYKNNAQIATGTLGITTKTYVFWTQSNVVGDSFAVNFGQQPFTYTPPTGFLALNTYNI